MEYCYRDNCLCRVVEDTNICERGHKQWEIKLSQKDLLYHIKVHGKEVGTTGTWMHANILVQDTLEGKQ